MKKSLDWAYDIAGTTVFSPLADVHQVTQRIASKPPATAGLMAPAPGLRFVARQPIFDRSENVFGYELLFRDGVENCFRSSDSDAASRSTVDSSLLMGLDLLCEGRRAFVNCTRDVLLKDYITLLPSSHTIVEVLETVPVDEAVLGACQRLKEAGYLIALDDFIANDPRDRLTEIADIIKVDLRRTTHLERAALVKRYGPWRRRMLAEKVETREEFVAARSQGFLYFQGYFFQRPEVMSTHEIPANRINYLRMLQAVARPEMDLREIETIIKGEASICYRLLRYLNSAIFSFSSEIHSVRHALSMMGEREIRRWVRLIATLGAAQQKSTELVLSALVRARFCELLGLRVPHGDNDLFFLGLLSLMDVILEIPMSALVEKLPLDREIKSVLLGEVNQLRPIYQLMMALESAAWEESAHLAKQLHLSESVVAELHWQAMQWAHQVTSGT